MKTLKILIAMAAAAAVSLPSFAQEDAQKAAEEAAKAIASAPQVEVQAPKPIYWTRTLTTNVNFIQTGYNNWAKGGYNNVVLKAYLDGNANYAKDKMIWKNRLQIDYGFLYSEDKPIIQKNTDRLLFESTAGYKATQTLSYSAKFTFQNQFTNGFTYPTPTNIAGEEPTKREWQDARLLKSGFLSPAIVNLGLGIDWVPTKWLTVNFAPLTGGFTIVSREALRPTYGMKLRKLTDSEMAAYEEAAAATYENYVVKGEAIGGYFRPGRFEFGAQLTLDAKMQVNDNFTASTHLLMFSDYLRKPQNVRVNWDNRLFWKVAKYFSLNFTTNLIYDDTVRIVQEKDKDLYPDGRRRVQFMENFSFGFLYTFASKPN
ncbi:MAG: DUF3078 domain-containing protein [Bacteroidales bacterium]|nr:DUF3078 domain-containing protein [Bacteroidales bacterium]